MLDAGEREALERRVAEYLRHGDHAAAATLTIESYGPEVLGYLAAVTRDRDAADEAFSIFSENLWRGLPRFRGDASVRTWAYMLARHALSRLQRDPHRRADRRVALSESPELANIVHRVRTETRSYLKTELKSELSRLRDELDPLDRTLFILRISRRMSWMDIARIVGDESDACAATLDREAWRLRKRFARARKAIAEKLRRRRATR